MRSSVYEIGHQCKTLTRRALADWQMVETRSGEDRLRAASCLQETRWCRRSRHTTYTRSAVFVALSSRFLFQGYFLTSNQIWVGEKQWSHDSLELRFFLHFSLHGVRHRTQCLIAPGIGILVVCCSTLPIRVMYRDAALAPDEVNPMSAYPNAV